MTIDFKASSETSESASKCLVIVRTVTSHIVKLKYSDFSVWDVATVILKNVGNPTWVSAVRGKPFRRGKADDQCLVKTLSIYVWWRETARAFTKARAWPRWHCGAAAQSDCVVSRIWERPVRCNGLSMWAPQSGRRSPSDAPSVGCIIFDIISALYQKRFWMLILVPSILGRRAHRFVLLYRK